jgi:7-cyano-7-deazaguanine synthase
VNHIKEEMKNKKHAVLSLSGGMDSSTLLLHLLSKGYECTCLSFDYGQKHKVELQRATELVEYINEEWRREYPPFAGPYDYSWYPITHQIIKLDGLSELLNSALVEGGKDVPEGHYEQDNMKDTVVPNRNKIFSSIIQAVALSIANKNDCVCHIAMGIHAGDHQIYLDCRQEFRDADYEAFLVGNDNAELVVPYTPYLEVDKFNILEDGLKCCEKLGLSFNEIYQRTNTSYKPIFRKFAWSDINNSGEWFSDFKSAASVERIEAFIKLGRPDPIQYAEILEDKSIVLRDWNYVKEHVMNIISEYRKNQQDK